MGFINVNPAIYTHYFLYTKTIVSIPVELSISLTFINSVKAIYRLSFLYLKAAVFQLPETVKHQRGSGLF